MCGPSSSSKYSSSRSARRRCSAFSGISGGSGQRSSIAARIAVESPIASPLIVVTGAFNGETSIACLRAGAEDLIIKGNLSRLATSITDALELRRPLERLTPRQLEVLRQVAEGHRTKEIAISLKLSVKTVESHRGAIMKRLNVHDVVTLARYAVRVGLVAAERSGRIS